MVGREGGRGRMGRGGEEKGCGGVGDKGEGGLWKELEGSKGRGRGRG